ncbi:MAG: MFS transporter [Opitutales bacterium]
MVAQTLTKVGDRLASPKTTLAWLLQALGAPALFIGLMVPVREAGALLPQMFIAGWLRSRPVRKWTWVGGALVQGPAVAGCAFVALTLGGVAAGAAVLGLVAAFSLARGFSSISSKDVLGKTIPKTRRGQLSGWMSSASGVIAMAAGAFLVLGNGRDQDAPLYAGFLAVAAGLRVLAAGVYSRVKEFSGETGGGGHAWAHVREKLGLLRTDRPFRNFVLVRALAVVSGLSAPFVIALAHRELGGAALCLGVFIIVDGFAAMVSAPLWRRLADASSRRVLRLAMGLTAGLLPDVSG